MKKKIITLMAALMVLTMGTTVLAAPSTNTGNAESYNDLVASIDETEVVDNGAVTETEAVEAAKAQFNANANTVVIKGLVDISPVGGVMPEGGVTTTFEVPGLTSEAVDVYHWDGSKWENTSCEVVDVDGTFVTATFTKLSPVAIVEVTEVAEVDPPEKELVSPKTADVVVLPALAFACAAVATACSKKVK